MNTIIAPSILAADWSRLAEEISLVEAAGAEWLHIDVMDGHFVPPITFGPKMVEAAKKSTKLFLDVHLMIENPEQQITDFANAGADGITVHVETGAHLHRTLQQIKELKLQAGVALNPATPLSAIEEILPSLDLLLIMTVNPGWGGQSYISDCNQKIARAASLISATGCSALIEVDGGINAQTAADAKKAGATVLVAGTYIFGSTNYIEAVSSLR